jgi:hypothetical protein
MARLHRVGSCAVPCGTCKGITSRRNGLRSSRLCQLYASPVRALCLIDGDNPLSVWAIGCGDRFVRALATSVNRPQERLDIICQVDGGPRVSLLSRAPLLPLGRGRLQPGCRRAGPWGFYGYAGRTSPHFGSDQANRDGHQQRHQGDRSQRDPVLGRHAHPMSIHGHPPEGTSRIGPSR